MHCTKLLINEFYKRTIDATKYFYLKLYKLVQCMFGACMVHVGRIYGEKKDVVRCLLGACVVYVQCIHDQKYSKEEQQTRLHNKLKWM